MIERLKKLKGKRRNVRITVSNDGDETRYDGYVVGLSQELLALHLLVDFHLDGYLFLRCGDICGVRAGEFERAMDKMLRALGVSGRVTVPLWLKCGSWQSLFRSLKKQGTCIRIESTTLGRSRGDLGTIIDVDDERMMLRSLDANARWETRPRIVAYENIVLVSIDDEYTRVYHEFVSGR